MPARLVELLGRLYEPELEDKWAQYSDKMLLKVGRVVADIQSLRSAGIFGFGCMFVNLFSPFFAYSILRSKTIAYPSPLGFRRHEWSSTVLLVP